MKASRQTIVCHSEQEESFRNNQTPKRYPRPHRYSGQFVPTGVGGHWRDSFGRNSIAMKIAASVALFTLCAVSANSSFAQSQFFAGKTITVVLGGPPAGSADMRTRAVTNLLRKHIPGNPNIIIQYMADGGGRQAANHVFNVAKPDGLTLGSMGAALVANAVLGEPGVQYDIDKFIYLGTPDSAQHYLFITHRDAGLNTLEKLRAPPAVRVGGQSVGHPVYITGRLFAYMLGLNDPRFVTG